MNSLELSIAGKTFMAGEYLALIGGPALMLATDPRFQMKIAPSSKTQENPFHPESPAGQFWNQQKDFFSKFEIQFEDPYIVGGFGASSAQFAMLHSFWQVQDSAFTESERFYDWHEMLTDYRNLPTRGTPPSGSDVIGAVTGGITWFDRNNGKIQSFAWPFQEMQFFVAHTGKKLATHEHLKNLENFETTEFLAAMSQIHQGLSQVNFAQLVEGMKSYRHELEKQNRVAEHTRELLAQLDQDSRIEFSKGCGAMGSDVILAFCHQENSQSVAQKLQALNLKVVADSSKLARGLQIRNLGAGNRELSL